MVYDEFLSHWKDYASRAKLEGKKSLHMLMTKENPIHVGKNHFKVQVDAQTLRETLNNEKPDLMEYLSEKLGTSKLSIEAELLDLDEDEKPKFFTTPKEKYEQMLAKNSYLKDFMDELGLDFD